MTKTARIHNKKLQIFVDDKDTAREIMNSLSAFIPGYEHNTLYRMGKFNGKKKFYTIKPTDEGWYFTAEIGFKKRIEDLLKIEVEDVKEDITDPIEFLKKALPKLPFKPYRHQLKMFLGMAESKAHLAISSTGSGKSLSIYLLLSYFRQKNKKIIVLVPTIDLTSQLLGDCKDYKASQEFIDDIQLIGGEFKDKDIHKPVVFSTWQSAQKSDMSSFDIVINDETHQAKADVLQSILSNPFKQKLGMTGTMPIEQLDALILESKFGQPKRYITAKQMMNMGLSTELTVVPLFLNHGKVPLMKYQDEVKYLKECPKRRKFIKNFLKKLSGLTVTLYNHTAHGEQTFEDITGVKCSSQVKRSFQTQKNLGVFFISGATPGKIRKEIREYLNDPSVTEDMIVIGQFNVLSTGINIPRLKNLVFLSSTKSYIKVIQSIGRVLRLHNTKMRAYVFDIVDDMTGHKRKTENYALKHFWQRNVFYEQEQFPTIEKEVDLNP